MPPKRLKSSAVAALLLTLCGAHAEPVTIPGPNGIVLKAELVLPSGPQRAPAIVALHGCGGPYPKRDNDWAVRLAARGHAVLLPDSFGSRDAGSQCTYRNRVADAPGLRRLDAIAAARWLAARPGTPPGGVAVMGWSDGGSTTVMAAARAPDLPPGLIRRFIAFYPTCRRAVSDSGYAPSAPMLILHGADDDWDAPEPCKELAARFPALVSIVLYPGAVHDFDVPDGPTRVRSGLTTPTGFAHIAPNPAARADALIRVPAFLEVP